MKQETLRKVAFRTSVRQTPLLLSILCLVLEAFVQDFYPFNLSFFGALAGLQTKTMIEAIIAIARSFYVYFIFFSLLEIIYWALSHENHRAKPFISFTVYFGFVFALTRLKPSAFSGWTDNWMIYYGIAFAVIFLVCAFARAPLNRKGDRPFLPVLNCVIAIAFLTLTRIETKAGSFPAQLTHAGNDGAQVHAGNDGRPSFVLFSMDGVPADIFYKAGAAPNWEKTLKEKSLNFQNAYSVTNSTYTSWFSVLSGKYPVDGVEFLYPNKRTTDAPLLPAELQQLGYRVSFLTDCATTSYLESNFGIDQLDQSQQGAFGCLRGAVSGSHPLNYFVYPAKLLPERDGFCSKLYRPEVFFAKVAQEWQRLSHETQPYLLMVHSCLTHRDVISHSPPWYSKLRNNLPEQTPPYSGREASLQISLRWFDELTHPLFEKIAQKENRPWLFLFSDHGVRIEVKDGEKQFFSHAYGEPKNRFQYNVPLSVLPGGSVPPAARFTQTQVSLLDIPATIRSLSGIPMTGDGKDLRFVDEFPQAPLLLTSSLPIVEPGENLLPLLKESRFDKNGNVFFEPALEHRLREKRSLAFLDLPFRLIQNAKGQVSLYDDLADPQNQTDLALQHPELARKLEDRLRNALANEHFDVPQL